MDVLEGLLFALLWASAAVDTKLAVHSVEPFLLTCLRFLTVAIILQFYTYVIKRKQHRLPTKKEFVQLFVLGLLNVAIYMCGYITAIKTVSAGLISLAQATNPVILILLSALILKKKITRNQVIGMIISIAGLILAAIPNLQHSHATVGGLIALIVGITALSLGSIYFSRSAFQLPKMVVNTWQITLGGLLFIPVVWLNPGIIYLKPDANFVFTFLWLVIPVTIIAYALWLNLLQKDAVKAGLWLFLTPALGYLMAIVFLHERITVYGIGGAIMVVGGLLYSRRA